MYFQCLPLFTDVSDLLQVSSLNCCVCVLALLTIYNVSETLVDLRQTWIYTKQYVIIRNNNYSFSCYCNYMYFKALTGDNS